MTKYLFIAGLHKSGTSILARCLAQHPDVSSFQDTGFPQDEGQFLQTIFPKAFEYGGPGKFGFSREMHLIEESHLLTETNKSKLITQWSRFWDLNKAVLLEKSPPNILKSRFLQAVFPESYFVFIIRHPLAVAYSTQRWSKTTLPELIEHWIKCHDIMQEDVNHLNFYQIIHYEKLIAAPERFLNDIYKSLSLNELNKSVILEQNTNEKYSEQWEKLLMSVEEESRQVVKSVLQFESRIQKFGYSLLDLNKTEQYFLPSKRE